MKSFSLQPPQTGTIVSHSSAEYIHFDQEFIKGNINCDLYSHLILNFYFVYETIECLLNLLPPLSFPPSTTPNN